ncbi:hypothetical protein [Calothrix sp. CCY 0018]|uniref:hypothetical protein n=1 Tax=Calothrix sp. CCY 0018 TaxID=3103864 RepID=UPI0039C635F9
MKEVLAHIEKKKQEFAKLDFFEFLADESIAPMERLGWAPCAAYFAMMFKDLNTYILRKEPADSPIQEMINRHSYEDGRHWNWYIKDLKEMGFDESLQFSDALKFLWGEETKKTRELCYKLSSLCLFEQDLLIKLVVIEAIEATGVIALPLLANLGNKLQELTKKRYSYFSSSHAKVETGHIIGGLEYDETEKFLNNIELTPEQRQKAIEAIEIVFDSYSEFTDEMLIYAKKHHRKNQNAIKVAV